MKSAREIALQHSECVLCCAFMDAGEGESTMGLVCDQCTENNEWFDDDDE